MYYSVYCHAYKETSQLTCTFIWIPNICSQHALHNCTETGAVLFLAIYFKYQTFKEMSLIHPKTNNMMLFGNDPNDCNDSCFCFFEFFPWKLSLQVIVPSWFLMQVLITVYWLGRAANSCTSYSGPTLDLKEFEALLSQMQKVCLS